MHYSNEKLKKNPRNPPFTSDDPEHLRIQIIMPDNRSFDFIRIFRVNRIVKRTPPLVVLGRGWPHDEIVTHGVNVLSLDRVRHV